MSVAYNNGSLILAFVLSVCSGCMERKGKSLTHFGNGALSCRKSSQINGLVRMVMTIKPSSNMKSPTSN